MFESEDDIERALMRASHEPSERPVFDARPLGDSSFADTLRTGIPLIAAERGFFSQLFR